VKLHCKLLIAENKSSKCIRHGEPHRLCQYVMRKFSGRCTDFVPSVDSRKSLLEIALSDQSMDLTEHGFENRIHNFRASFALSSKRHAVRPDLSIRGRSHRRAFCVNLMAIEISGVSGVLSASLRHSTMLVGI